MVVGVLEDKVSQAIDTPDPAVFVHRLVADHLPDIVGVVVVEDVDAAGVRLEHHRVRSFRTIVGLDVHGVLPSLAAIDAATADHVLASGTFCSGSGSDDAEPGTVVGFHDVGLIRVELVGNHGSSDDVTRVMNLSEYGRSKQQK